MTRRIQRVGQSVLLLFGVFVGHAFGEVKLVDVEVLQDKVWVGEKAPFFVKLRGKGPFVGASSFSLPQIARTVIIKVGTPVVSTEEIGDDSWFVQTHEFALFSQQEGKVEVPSFEVRFSDRDGFTGPATDHTLQVPAIQFQVERPKGSDSNAFLVTTDSLEVTQQWDPAPGKAKQGAVFHRTITQEAEQLSGMALAPPSTKVPEGVALHLDDPVITDDTERGEFAGSRTDTLTYVFEQPGSVTLPAILYVWWDPEIKKYGSTTLPAATFEIAAVASPAGDAPAEEVSHRWLVWLTVALVVCGLCYWQRHRLAATLATVRNTINPPERRTERKLIGACRTNDARATEAAWTEWRNLQPGLPLPTELQAAATNLHRHLYGPGPKSTWDGRELATAIKQMHSTSHSHDSTDNGLPHLNPTG